MLCVMQNHIVQAFANSGNAIKPVSFIRDLKSKSGFLTQPCCLRQWVPSRWRGGQDEPGTESGALWLYPAVIWCIWWCRREEQWF